MSLATGARLGPYEVVSLIGAGGMGEVYRARDTSLNRHVALKVLPAALAASPDRLMRFQREAEVLAALNHPNVAQIYGLERTGTVPALVLELVEGPTLADRIRRGPIPVAEALSVARQIAEALEAAHERGIIHRDLKPANIKVREDGTVKVLDFGLAKAMDLNADRSFSSAGAADPEGLASLAESPTVTSPALTQMGTILGTAAYMSPEQARGKPVDKRSDIWAFGVVLFEMLTGRRAFDGDDITDVIAAVVKLEPDWSAVPAGTPVPIRKLLRQCLEKDRKERTPDIAVARFAIREALDAPGSDTATAAAKPPTPLWRRAWPLAIGVAAGAAAVWTSGGLRATDRQPPAVVRLLMDTRASIGSSPQGWFVTGTFAFSPDGSRLVLVSDGRLVVRALADFEEVPVPGLGPIENPANLLFSPDGESVVFSDGRDVKRVGIAGGVPIQIARLEDAPVGLSWDGDTLIAGLGANGIARVPVDGGEVTSIVTLQPGERAALPRMLPGGDIVLFTLTVGDWLESRIVAQSLSSGTRTVVVPSGSDAWYLPTGHLAYAVEGVWFGVAFDPRTLRTLGLPIPLIEGVARGTVGGLPLPNAFLSVAPTGTLAYRSGFASITGTELIALTNRDGRERVLDLPARNYESPRVSPDGTRLAVSSTEDGTAVIRVTDLAGTRAEQRLTFSGSNQFPVWSPDGRQLAFQSSGDGDPGIFVRRADGTGDAERLTTAEDGAQHIPESWSHDGHLSYTILREDGAELWLLSVADKQSTRVGDVSSTSPFNSSISPDGRWIAYTVRGSPPAVVFVRHLSARTFYQVSPADDVGHHPFWSHDGRELFYFGVGGNFMVSVSVEPAGSGLVFGNQRPLQVDFLSVMTSRGPLNYDILPDDRTFVWTKPVDFEQPRPGDAGRLRLVLNWFEDLRARVPVAR